MTEDSEDQDSEDQDQETILPAELDPLLPHEKPMPAFLDGSCGELRLEFRRPPAESTSPYYCEQYGKMVKQTIDAVRAAPDKFFAWPLPKGYRLSTLAQMFNNGKRYLINYMDDEKLTYRTLCFNIKTRKVRRHDFVGLSIYWKAEVSVDHIRITNIEKEKVEEAAGYTVEPGWQAKLEEFIQEAAPGDAMTIKKLILDEFTKHLLAMLLTVSSDFVYSYDNGSRNLRVVRLTEKEAEQLRAEQAELENQRE